jgi:hypothetical protein
MMKASTRHSERTAATAQSCHSGEVARGKRVEKNVINDKKTDENTANVF